MEEKQFELEESIDVSKEEYDAMTRPKKGTRLVATTLRTHDTCFTYALKRTGTMNSDLSYMSSAEFIKWHGYSSISDMSMLVPGDILFCFLTEPSEHLIDNHITEDGRILEGKVKLEHHFLVYEGDGIVSEATSTTEQIYGIRQRRLSPIIHKYNVINRTWMEKFSLLWR
jgi:hypothetical protein